MPLQRAGFLSGSSALRDPGLRAIGADRISGPSSGDPLGGTGFRAWRLFRTDAPETKLRAPLGPFFYASGRWPRAARRRHDGDSLEAVELASSRERCPADAARDGTSNRLFRRNALSVRCTQGAGALKRASGGILRKATYVFDRCYWRAEFISSEWRSKSSAGNWPTAL